MGAPPTPPPPHRSVPTPRLLAVPAALLVAATVRAQQPSAPDSTAAVPRPSPVTSAATPTAGDQAALLADSIEAGLAARASAAILADRDGWLAQRRDAETRWATANARAGALRDELRASEQLRDAVEKKLGLAKKEKREIDRAAAESERKGVERRIDLLRARRELAVAEGELARLEREHADAAVRAADAEQAVAERKAVATPVDPVQRIALEELQSRWLQALRTREQRAMDVADRRLRVVESRQALLERARRR